MILRLVTAKNYGAQKEPQLATDDTGRLTLPEGGTLLASVICGSHALPPPHHPLSSPCTTSWLHFACKPSLVKGNFEMIFFAGLQSADQNAPKPFSGQIQGGILAGYSTIKTSCSRTLAPAREPLDNIIIDRPLEDNSVHPSTSFTGDEGVQTLHQPLDSTRGSSSDH
ncbi:hypothetical protein J6590_038671 [Homalodisca vitripennis]|nr:hypothetical protein J6590_038671 [Homalodisca vitripennis]